MTELSSQVESLTKDVGEFINKTNEEVSAHGKMGVKNQEALKSLTDKIEAHTETLADLEQKFAAPKATANRILTLGDAFAESDAFASFKNSGSRARLDIQNNTTVGSDVTVAPDRRGGIVPGASRALRVADVLLAENTSSNAVEYTRELVWTDNAAETNENSAKPESAITFELISSPVKTIAHWLKVSKQVADDSPLLVSYINGRLAYGVEHRCDSQLINGSGTGSNLLGMLATAGTTYTTFTRGTVGAPLTEQIRGAITQVQVADYNPTAVIMNPEDVESIDLEETTDAEFRAANPRMSIPNQVWGLPIVVTNAMPQGSFLIGAFDMATAVISRQGTVVEMFEQDDTNVQSNLITLRAEQRKAIAHYRPLSVVGGAFL